jgi:hypothetical protein
LIGLSGTAHGFTPSAERAEAASKRAILLNAFAARKAALILLRGAQNRQHNSLAFVKQRMPETLK